MDHIIGLKELRQNVTKYAEEIGRGASFIVMKRSRPLFRIAPVDEEGWETVIDFTQFRKGGMPVDELLARLKKMR